MRTVTPTEYVAPGRRIIHVKRACNGCGELIGDVTGREIEDGIEGLPLSDVRAECDWCATKASLARTMAEQDEFYKDMRSMWSTLAYIKVKCKRSTLTTRSILSDEDSRELDIAIAVAKHMREEIEA